MLTTELDCVYTQKLITLFNLENNRMSRIEVIGIIKKNKAYFEKAQQHWYYCRRATKFPELKNRSVL